MYELHHDPAALELVQKGFHWYDEHGHDAEHGGYFEILTAEGMPNPNAIPAVGGPPGTKSMNSTVHMLEALTAVYRVWPDPKVRARLRELFEIVRDKMVRDPGYLVQFFTTDWQPKPNDDSYGHDVEVAYLLTEAAEALEIPNDPATWEAAKKLVDHAMQVGWDKTNGGLFNSGGIDGGNFAPDARMVGGSRVAQCAAIDARPLWQKRSAVLGRFSRSMELDQSVRTRPSSRRLVAARSQRRHARPRPEKRRLDRVLPPRSGTDERFTTITKTGRRCANKIASR